ncbi:hypothetical protein JOF56_005794 [Kibdelosporangium banguiense]|uniref:Uncharacterized protein n=1 Tax=Kibdelosporangium banguiense TaxID=1365924 RepID=A0ABS4TM41_9PSEU|nr:hypothetical protein [Kibdelosporangium banguiense]MBP2325409.1 hypothetical protein [Kibdelosporangium banguiense]
MTLQPNDRKHEHTPEFQDEAQQKTERAAAKTGARRAGASAQKDVPSQKDVPAQKDAADQGPDSVANQDRAKVENRPEGGLRPDSKHHAPDSRKPAAAENQAPVASRTRLFEEQEVTRFREQWRELQAGFVDEPRSAVREADTLVTQMMDSLTSQLAAQKRALQGESDAVDTERLRVTLQRYRSLFDQMLQV